ncbi:hypothetical protein H671_2g5320 [Cricetulus griseus]|nr:hypothetical protein H671_2g5320 [Cricetulus griseus]
MWGLGSGREFWMVKLETYGLLASSTEDVKQRRGTGMHGLWNHCSVSLEENELEMRKIGKTEVHERLQQFSEGHISTQQIRACLSHHQRSFLLDGNKYRHTQLMCREYEMLGYSVLKGMSLSISSQDSELCRRGGRNSVGTRVSGGHQGIKAF